MTERVYRTARELLAAVALIVGAALLRVWPLGSLGARVPWLTFYPAVMLAALYGGVYAGLLATLLGCGVALFLGPALVGQPFLTATADYIGMAVFVLTSSMISVLAESMRRANARALEAQAEAEAASQAKSAFLASMSHELRTPLNAILGFSALLRGDPDMTGEQRGILDIINRSGEHLLTLINDVLDMAKVESGRLAVADEVFDLGETVRDVVDLMRFKAEEKGLGLRLDQSSEFPRFVLGDQAKLRQVLVNLVGNAVKFTERGEVTLRLGVREPHGTTGSVLTVEVVDTGVGIPADDRDTIFDAFVQAGAGGGQKGTGLGLAITRRYVEMMGGRIWVESEAGSGSRFAFEIPCTLARQSDLEALEVDRGAVVGLAAGQPSYRILIVEDQMENSLLLRRLMERVGMQVRVAEDGAAGISAFEEWQPDLIWMDVRMPVMDGKEATRRIRALPDGDRVRIIALTASVFQEERADVLAAGMDDFLRKPFRPDEIYRALGDHLGLEFVREDSRPSETEPAALQAEAVAALPESLRAELADALVGLDAARIDAVIDRVREVDEACGAAMAEHAARLSYTPILRVLSVADLRVPGAQS